jgi:hypothetical protein
MPRVLHILTRADDTLSREIIDLQRAEMGREGIEIVDLAGASPDYGDLLNKIFEADSVECW